MASPTQLKGSFRGVPFELTGHVLEGGRRTATHEFPYRDVPYTEDLGQRARTFSLDAYVLGDDVYARRDALRAAFEKRGPGTLVHPYLGTLTVQVTGYSIGEVYSDQRLARVTVTFVEAGKLLFPSTAANPVSQVSAASTNASIYAGSQAIKIDTSTVVAMEHMAILMDYVTSDVETAGRRAARPKGLAALADAQDAIRKMSSFVSDAAKIASLIKNPDLMSYSLADLIFRVGGLGMSPLQAFFAYGRLLGDLQARFNSLRPQSTPAGAIAAQNTGLVRDVAYTAVVSSAAVAAVDAEYMTHEQAVAARVQLAGMLDVAMGQLTDDVLFGYLQDIRALALTQIPRPDEDLPSIVKVSVPLPLPSLVLSHALMSGSADEQRLIDINAVRNPWFAPNNPTSPLLVLR